MANLFVFFLSINAHRNLNEWYNSCTHIDSYENIYVYIYLVLLFNIRKNKMIITRLNVCTNAPGKGMNLSDIPELWVNIGPFSFGNKSKRY